MKRKLALLFAVLATLLTLGVVAASASTTGHYAAANPNWIYMF